MAKIGTVPAYIRDMMERAAFNYHSTRHPDYCVGYTIDIDKYTTRAYASTLQNDIDKLQKWVERGGGEIKVLNIPRNTHYCHQYATVTIFDPVMRSLEGFIRK